MKAKIFALPLVALLVGCNNSEPAFKDGFKKIRDVKIDQSIKDEIMSKYYGYSLVNEIRSVLTYQEKGETVTQVEEFTLVGTLHCDPNSNNGSFTLQGLTKGYVITYADITLDKGAYSGTVIEGFPLNLQETYVLYKDLIFSWNCSIVSGNLGSAYSIKVMESNGLYKKIASRLQVNGDIASGTFTVTANGPFNYKDKQSGVTMVYKNFKVGFSNYLLSEYTLDADTIGNPEAMVMDQSNSITTTITYFTE